MKRFSVDGFDKVLGLIGLLSNKRGGLPSNGALVMMVMMVIGLITSFQKRRLLTLRSYTHLTGNLPNMSLPKQISDISRHTSSFLGYL